MNRIRVLIVDDHLVVRQGLRALLENNDDIEIVGEAGDGFDAIREAREINPDVILMDIKMPHLDGIEATRSIKTYNPSIKIIMLTMYSREDFLAEAVKVGADAYLLKDECIDTLVNIIRTIYNGETGLRNTLERAIRPTLVKTTHDLQKFKSVSEPREESERGTLSPREVEILSLVSQGYTNKMISYKCFVSETTVKAHLRRIMEKLNALNRAQAIALAVEKDLI